MSQHLCISLLSGAGGSEGTLGAQCNTRLLRRVKASRKALQASATMIRVVYELARLHRDRLKYCVAIVAFVFET